YGPIGAFLAEKFDTQDRYTGVSLTFQIGSVLGAGTAPLMATWLVNLDTGLMGTSNIAIYFIFLIVLATIAVYFSRETMNRNKTPRAKADAGPSPEKAEVATH